MNYRQKNIYFPLLILFSSVLNIAGSILAGESSFPLYMDSFATIAIAAMGGGICSICNSCDSYKRDFVFAWKAQADFYFVPTDDGSWLFFYFCSYEEK